MEISAMSDTSEMTQTEKLTAVEQLLTTWQAKRTSFSNVAKEAFEKNNPELHRTARERGTDFDERICELRLALGLPLKRG
jgi:hypothetical protein